MSPADSATIEIALDGAFFDNVMNIDATGPNQTRITQTLRLRGPNAASFQAGMNMFESSAPQGLAKLASAIEEALNGRNKVS